MDDKYVLQLKNVSKEYFGNKVLKEVNLDVKAGEIHALVGENGAGKSTLMNIIFGMPVIHSTGGYTGDIIFDGQKVEIKSPNDALALGIGMVHQEFMLLPGFTITENIKLNREITKHNVVSRVLGDSLKSLDIEAMRKDSQRALQKLGMNIDDWIPIAGLPVGYMQFVEIAREIDKKNIKLLVFDEPTAVLAESEADRLLDAMRKLAATGIAILFITHRLDEVLAVGDVSFQRKCLGQMGDVAKSGRTVLFVSHNMAAIQSLCNRAILFDSGKIIDDGACKNVIDAYLSTLEKIINVQLSDRQDKKGNRALNFISYELSDSKGTRINKAYSGQDLIIILKYNSNKIGDIHNVKIN
jgi:simple sugar transport system ATP-binding protein